MRAGCGPVARGREYVPRERTAAYTFLVTMYMVGVRARARAPVPLTTTASGTTRRSACPPECVGCRGQRWQHVWTRGARVAAAATHVSPLHAGSERVSAQVVPVRHKCECGGCAPSL